ncbi:MAG: hypothetical protein LLG04_01590 [Parachlamydia sp.]|nr:hypothetical protein [Parachlamydia sp.]
MKFHAKFSVWLAQEFLACKEFKADVDPDSHNILKRLKNETVREKMFHAVVGHELGHSYYNHIRKDYLARFGLRLLSLPTLSLTSLFEERLMQKLKRRQEWEADLFSARKLGGAEGLIADFSQSLETGLNFHNGLPGIKCLTHI